MAALSLAAGLLASNVTGLQWSQVDLARPLAWVHSDQAKARRAIPVPLNGDAASLVRKRLGKHRTHAFGFRDNPIIQASTNVRYAGLERAGIADIRWHDLRNTWESWPVQNGTPLFALQELGAGRARRWRGGTRTSPRTIWRPIRNVSARRGPWWQTAAAQLPHWPETTTACPKASR